MIKKRLGEGEGMREERKRGGALGDREGSSKIAREVRREVAREVGREMVWEYREKVRW